MIIINRPFIFQLINQSIPWCSEVKQRGAHKRVRVAEIIVIYHVYLYKSVAALNNLRLRLDEDMLGKILIGTSLGLCQPKLGNLILLLFVEYCIYTYFKELLT